MRVLACIWALLGALAPLAAAEDLPSAAQVRQGIAKSLPFLEREGLAWVKNRNCMSCHVFSFTIWSHYEAQRAGIAVDQAKLSDWMATARAEVFEKREWFKLAEAGLKALPEDGVPSALVEKLAALKDQTVVTEPEFVAAAAKVIGDDELAQHRAALVKRATQPKSGRTDGGGLDTLHQLILGGAPLATDEPWRNTIVELIGQWQEADGSWKAAGQMPSLNRTPAEAAEITTAWTVLALSSLESSPTIQPMLERAQARLKDMKPGKSLESLAVCLLLERKLGHADQAQELLKQLRGRQNNDGGWSYLPGKESDAFATGQALYALSLCDVSPEDESIRRGQAYLLKTQGDDGVWNTPPTAVSSATAEARIKRLEPIYRYWGTAWAAIGLARSLPK